MVGVILGGELLPFGATRISELTGKLLIKIHTWKLGVWGSAWGQGGLLEHEVVWHTVQKMDPFSVVWI